MFTGFFKNTFAALILGICAIGMICMQNYFDKKIATSITVEAEWIVKIIPDVIIFDAKAQIEKAETKEIATNQLAETITKMNQILEKYEIDSKNVKTENFNINEYREWEEDKYVAKWFEAHQSTTIKLEKLEKEKIDTIIAELSVVPNLSLILVDTQNSDNEKLYYEAYEKALTSAYEKAQKIASINGAKSIKLQNISESEDSDYGIYNDVYAMASKSELDQENMLDFSFGEDEYSVSVVATYILEY